MGARRIASAYAAMARARSLRYGLCSSCLRRGGRGHKNLSRDLSLAPRGASIRTRHYRRQALDVKCGSVLATRFSQRSQRSPCPRPPCRPAKGAARGVPKVRRVANHKLHPRPDLGPPAIEHRHPSQAPQKRPLPADPLGLHAKQLPTPHAPTPVKGAPDPGRAQTRHQAP